MAQELNVLAQWAIAGNVHVLEVHMETRMTRDSGSHCHALFTSSGQQPSSNRNSHSDSVQQALLGSALR